MESSVKIHTPQSGAGRQEATRRSHPWKWRRWDFWFWAVSSRGSTSTSHCWEVEAALPCLPHKRRKHFRNHEAEYNERKVLVSSLQDRATYSSRREVKWLAKGHKAQETPWWQERMREDSGLLRWKEWMCGRRLEAKPLVSGLVESEPITQVHELILGSEDLQGLINMLPRLSIPCLYSWLKWPHPRVGVLVSSGLLNSAYPFKSPRELYKNVQSQAPPWANWTEVSFGVFIFFNLSSVSNMWPGLRTSRSPKGDRRRKGSFLIHYTAQWKQPYDEPQFKWSYASDMSTWLAFILYIPCASHVSKYLRVWTNSIPIEPKTYEKNRQRRAVTC